MNQAYLPFIAYKYYESIFQQEGLWKYNIAVIGLCLVALYEDTQIKTCVKYQRQWQVCTYGHSTTITISYT